MVSQLEQMLLKYLFLFQNIRTNKWIDIIVQYTDTIYFLDLEAFSDL